MAPFLARTHRRIGFCRSQRLESRRSSRRHVMDRHVPRVILCAVLLVVGAAAAGAQQFTGGVRGEVRDQNGVIPGVTVTLVNEATNIAREVVTNEVGQYNFPAVAPGTYTLRTKLTGYKSYESKGLIVGTQQFITLDV